MIAGLEEITDGEHYIGNRLVNDIAPLRTEISRWFSRTTLFISHMTVFENMAFGLKLRKTPKDEIARKVEEAARILTLLTFSTESLRLFPEVRNSVSLSDELLFVNLRYSFLTSLFQTSTLSSVLR